jgi:hypothetical protein
MPDLGNCARCLAELPGEHHPQELPCIYVDEGRLLCGDCGLMFSHYAHSCFLGQWIQERERWPLSPYDRLPSGNGPTSGPTKRPEPPPTLRFQC